MSESENGFLLKRISELERALVETNAEAKKRRIQLRDANKALAEFKAGHEQFAKDREALQKSPSEWQAKYEAIEQQLRVRDHRDAWLKVVGESLNEKVPLEEVWSKIKYQPGEGVPTEAEIKSQVKAARDVAPYLFRQESEPAKSAPVGAQPPSKLTSQVPFEASRGAPDTGLSRFKVLRSDMRNADFMMTHSKQIAEASKKGILDIIPD
jgi:hypothetical protein